MNKNPTLYNCCTGNREPDWTNFDAFEVSPCRTEPFGNNTHETFTEPCADYEADFWTVYGHTPYTGVEAITDVPTRKLALQIAALFGRFTGYPVYDMTEARNAYAFELEQVKHDVRRA